MADPYLFVGMWAAGVVEGASVLSHHAPKKNAALFIVPSLLYGTFLVPLGVVGALPGPGAFIKMAMGGSSLQPTWDDERSSPVTLEETLKRTDLMAKKLEIRTSVC